MKNRTVIFGGKPVTLAGKEIKSGDKAPDFTVVNSGLKPVKLSDYSGNVIIIAVYPSIDTGVCQAQNRRFNAEATKMEDVVVLSISCDLPFAQRRFCAAEGLSKVIALSDHLNVEFGIKYGFLMEELRLLARGTVVIDTAGIVRYVEYVAEIIQEPNYDAALKIVKDLRASL
ncbi:MAG: thiol peroxidase [Bacteroidales bacterium]|jgi:thiol peroxidase|nr:thiol peroxidase [Bacteroidales bacterium]MDD2264712.1 thiol peroxidase [Bacteroidales bacterium]MDD2832165.1 thiol peroxidase [Bacteroidales bacterium]MDD3209060.1 thiol peroxidase [Bacteroidales bacterium]MDD3697932.1 thiol peroxidase [Bacteroidales bacterium]